MKSSIIATTLLSAAAIAQTTGQLGDAEVVTGLPIGVTYKATLLNKNTTTLRGTVTGTTNSDGTGIVWTVDVSGFPDSSLGPFCESSLDTLLPCDLRARTVTVIWPLLETQLTSLLHHSVSHP